MIKSTSGYPQQRATKREQCAYFLGCTVYLVFLVQLNTDILGIMVPQELAIVGKFQQIE